MTDTGTDETIGRSFRQRSLEGADFTGKDVRGADFTGASLRGAKFTRASFGVAPRTGMVVLLAGILTAIAAGVAIGWAVDEIRDQVYAEEWDRAASGASMLFVLLAFVGLVIWRGFDTAIRAAVALYLVVLAGNIIANFFWDDIDWSRVLSGTLLLAILFLAILAGILGRLSGGASGSWGIALVAILGGLASGRADGGVAGIIVALILVAISKRALHGDLRDRSLRRLAHQLVGRWGTRFDDADLTGADFTGADASRCSVKGATLEGVTWDPSLPLPLDLPRDATPAGR